ncbi:MAG: EamA family transporter [Micromonosporaceae bacterium]|nr:EamA family transporter [Micromonosporaceae bacterium]
MRRPEAGPGVAPVGAALVGVFLYSLSPVLVRASELSGPVFAFWRMLLAVPVLLLAVAVARRGRPEPVGAGNGWWLPVAGGVGLAANQLATMSALKLTSVANVALIGTLAPLIIAGLGVWLLRERQRPMFWVWTLVAMAGAMFVVVAESGGVDASVWGMVLALVGVVAFAVFMLCARHSSRTLSQFLFRSTVAGAVLLTGFVLVTGADLTVGSRADLLRVAAVVLGSGTVGHWLFTWSLRATSAGFGAVMRLLQPVLAGIIAWLLLAESVTAPQLIGGGVILAGVTAVVLESRRPPPLV